MTELKSRLELSTPGPWEYEGEDGVVFAGETVLAAVLTDFRTTPQERDQNAYLIAAAPELLRALMELKEWARVFEVFRDEEGQVLLAKVDAALVKALGYLGEE